jgi:hypothetical protein
MFCALVFFFALHAKTAVYRGVSQPKITPSTASKLWAGGEKVEGRFLAPPSVSPSWLICLALLGLCLYPKRRFQDALVVPPPRNLRLRHLHRFLRPPPVRS